MNVLIEYIKQYYIEIGIALLCIVLVLYFNSRNFYIWRLKWRDDHIVSIKSLGKHVNATDIIMSKIGDSIKEFNIIQHTKDNYTVLEIPNLLSHEECDEIIKTSKENGMEDSTVLGYGNEVTIEKDEKYRKSKQVWLPDSTGPIFQKIANITEKLTKLPVENQEMLQIVAYEEGGHFNEHFDGCVYNDKTYCDKINRNAGERKATLLIYLNDNFEGGETEFVHLDIKIKPKKGNAILFINTTDAQINIEESMHCGHPVRNGQKWICTKWIHFNAFI